MKKEIIYNVKNNIDKDKANTKLKEIINKKLYRIIELMEFNSKLDE